LSLICSSRAKTKQCNRKPYVQVGLCRLIMGQYFIRGAPDCIGSCSRLQSSSS